VGLASVLFGTGTHRAFAGSVTVDDPRPVAAAIEAIEEATGTVITYEDPPTPFGSATTDVTNEISRVAPTGTFRSLIPKGGMLTFNLPTSATQEATLDSVGNLLRSYNSGRNVATFALVRGSRIAHVVPRNVLGSSGLLEPITPPLDSSIALSAAPRTGVALLQEICDAVSEASGQSIQLGLVPTNALDGQTIAVGPKAEPARALLEKLLVNGTIPLSWELLYDPGLKTYYFNVVPVRAPASHG
jgi:hypothetical protein